MPNSLTRKRRTITALSAAITIALPAYAYADPASTDISGYQITDEDAGKISRYISENPDQFSGFWFENTTKR